MLLVPSATELVTMFLTGTLRSPRSAERGMKMTGRHVHVLIALGLRITK